MFLIDANTEDTRQKLIDFSKAKDFQFSILSDESQVVSDELKFQYFGETLFINTKNWSVVKRGEVSNLKSDLDDLLNNKKSTHPTHFSNEEKIKYKNVSFLSFKNDIAPIIGNRCLNCHSLQGGFLPVFDSFDKLKSWKAMSKETILNDRMPPFSGDTYFGDFKNNISLNPLEKRKLISWINSGMPNDTTSKSDPIANFTIKKFPKEKLLKKFKKIYSVSPDHPVDIPPGGTLEYLFNQIGGATPYDMWVEGINVTSNNPRQLHHASLCITSKPLSFYQELIKKKFPKREEVVKKSVDGDIPRFVLSGIQSYEKKFNRENYYRAQVWAAGKLQPIVFKKHHGFFIPKGSYLILESHYMGNGKQDKEMMKLDFLGDVKRPSQFIRLHLLSLTDTDINITPNAKNHEEITKEVETERDINLISFLGHLHMRGKSVKLVARDPQGKTKTLISIPNYYYGWQTGSSLALKNPILIKKGTKLFGVCHYDNSSQNPNNPDPNQLVHFGQRADRTEMCNLHLTYTVAGASD